MIKQNIKWNANYDVVVLGFGGAGGTAARFAADNGAEVLLIDAAPFGHEGGNTRYSAQHIAIGHDKEKIEQYYKNLAKPFNIPEKVLQTYVNGLVYMPDYLKKFLLVKHPYIASKDAKPGKPFSDKKTLAEFPELSGSESFDFALVHDRDFDAGLWKLIKQNVISRKKQIDVWLQTRARHLIQNPINSEIVGVEIERNGHNYYIHARHGVILALGGFENNSQMQQNYLLDPKRTPLGTLYNRGDGIKMSEEVGANLWHMNTFENHGIMPGYTFYEGENKQGRQIKWDLLSNGSIFAVSDDGTRFFNENANGRHGHIYCHGKWEVPTAFENAYLIFDNKQFKKFSHEYKKIYPTFMEKLIKADNLSELAKKIKVPFLKLTDTVKRFNSYVNNQKDIEFNRSIKSMTLFEGSQVYAIKIAPSILNTQGGPERNEKAEILDVNGNPIPHLFGAGELGGVCVNHYQGGSNLAECLIFGRLAGENATKTTVTEKNVTLLNKLPKINDLISHENVKGIPLKANQFIGVTDEGLGGKIVVRLTYENNTIKNIEILESHETTGIGELAISELSKKMVKANSTKVDAISGASTTSMALKAAVNQALGNAKEGREK